MNKHSTTFDIIRFTADGRQYYPASMRREKWMPDNYVKQHTEVEIKIGQSRYGGPVIDFPRGMELPASLLFAAQLDLKVFSPHDKSALLPKTGYLYFFADIVTDKGKVLYVDVDSENLVRIIREHEDNFFLGVLIDKIYPETERWEERFGDPGEQWNQEHMRRNNKMWDSSAGREKSKLFGIFTHCQYSQEHIESITFSEKLLLLQVGEDGFNDEGVFSVVIPAADLKKLNFANVDFAWGQS